MEIFTIAAQQMIKLFAFMAAGYLIRKMKTAPESTASSLSRLEVDVFLPALCFHTFASNFHVDTLRVKWPFLAIGALTLAGSFVLSLGLSRAFAKDRPTRDVYLYSLIIPNMGYLGYPVVGAVFGQEMLLNAMLFALPFNMFIYTAGMYILDPNKRWSWGRLINPTIVAILLGSAVGLMDVRMPDVVTETVTMASACMAPVAMILTGFVLGGRNFAGMLRSARVYLAALIRLIAVPLCACGALILMKVPGEFILIPGVMLALPFGLNSVIFPEAFGGDSATGAQMVFVSNLMAVLTIPLMFGLVMRVLGM